MSKKKLIAGAATAAALTIGGGAALAAGPDTAATDRTSSDRQEEPSYNGSIQAPAEEGEQNEAAESRQLQSLAKIDQAAAEQAALQAVPGSVEEAELGNENGSVVWEVEVAGQDGKSYEVKVDAGNGKILARETGDDEASEQSEASEGSEGPEAGEAAE